MSKVILEIDGHFFEPQYPLITPRVGEEMDIVSGDGTHPGTLHRSGHFKVHNVTIEGVNGKTHRIIGLTPGGMKFSGGMSILVHEVRRPD